MEERSRRTCRYFEGNQEAEWSITEGVVKAERWETRTAEGTEGAEGYIDTKFQGIEAYLPTLSSIVDIKDVHPKVQSIHNDVSGIDTSLRTLVSDVSAIKEQVQKEVESIRTVLPFVYQPSEQNRGRLVALKTLQNKVDSNIIALAGNFQSLQLSTTRIYESTFSARMQHLVTWHWVMTWEFTPINPASQRYHASICNRCGRPRSDSEYFKFGHHCLEAPFEKRHRRH